MMAGRLCLAASLVWHMLSINLPPRVLVAQQRASATAGAIWRSVLDRLGLEIGAKFHAALEAEQHMAEDKYKQYARYAAYCLEKAALAKDLDERAIQNEMAAEWLELADTVLQPLKDWGVIKPE